MKDSSSASKSYNNYFRMTLQCNNNSSNNFTRQNQNIIGRNRIYTNIYKPSNISYHSKSRANSISTSFNCNNTTNNATRAKLVKSAINLSRKLILNSIKLSKASAKGEIRDILNKGKNETELEAFRKDQQKFYYNELKNTTNNLIGEPNYNLYAQKATNVYPNIEQNKIRSFEELTNENKKISNEIFNLELNNAIIKDNLQNIRKHLKESFFVNNKIDEITQLECEMSLNCATIQTLNEQSDKNNLELKRFDKNINYNLNNDINHNNASNDSYNEAKVNNFEEKINLFLDFTFSPIINGKNTEKLIQEFPIERTAYNNEIKELLTPAVENRCNNLETLIIKYLNELSPSELEQADKIISEKIKILDQNSQTLGNKEFTAFKEYTDSIILNIWPLNKLSNKTYISNLVTAEENFHLNESKLNSLKNLSREINSKKTALKEQESKNIISNIDKIKIEPLNATEIKNRSINCAKLIIQDVNDALELNKSGGQNEPIEFFYENHKENIQERIISAKKDLESGGRIKYADFVLSDKFKEALLERGIDTKAFESLYGTLSQQTTHKQILEAGELIISDNNLTDNMRTLGLDLIPIANDYNVIGDQIKANCLVDAVNCLSAIGKGISRGIVKGTISGIKSALNPFKKLETCIFLTEAISKATYLHDLMEDNQPIPSFIPQSEKINEYREKLLTNELERIKNNISDITYALKNLSKEEIAEYTASFITESIISENVNKSLTKFLNSRIPGIDKLLAKGVNSIKDWDFNKTEALLKEEILYRAKQEKTITNIIKKAKEPGKTNFILIGNGSQSRKVEYKKGLIHGIDKHFFNRSGKYEKSALKNLDPKGNPDKWVHFIMHLAQNGEGQITTTKIGKQIEILGKMPKTGGGELNIGVRMFKPNDSDTWSLSTIITMQ